MHHDAEMETLKMLRLGTELSPIDRRHALVAFVHRYTGDHKPVWAAKRRPNGEAYPLQFASDADWLAHTKFHVRSDGRLDERFRHCLSSPTWPNNPELRRVS